MCYIVCCSPLGAESAKPQMLLFSATVPYWVREVADKYMSHDRVVVDLIGGESLKTAVSVEHKAICCLYAESTTLGKRSSIREVMVVIPNLRLGRGRQIYMYAYTCRGLT